MTNLEKTKEHLLSLASGDARCKLYQQLLFECGADLLLKTEDEAGRKEIGNRIIDLMTLLDGAKLDLKGSTDEWAIILSDGKKMEDKKWN